MRLFSADAFLFVSELIKSIQSPSIETEKISELMSKHCKSKRPDNRT